MPTTFLTWTGSLHQVFRLLPAERRSSNLKIFLDSEGLHKNEVLSRLPYDRARSGGSGNDGPDPKRYRDPRLVYQTVGLLYEDDDGTLRLTELGRATRRWLDILTPNNKVILARHAAYALAACQLRNPSGSGQRYDDSMRVFPFSFIWRAMLALDGRLSSEEINRGLFKVRDEKDLQLMIERLRAARLAGNYDDLGDQVVTGENINDRIIPWASLASFGWTLFKDKRGSEDGDYYSLAPDTLSIVREASRATYRHREFASIKEYVEYLSSCAALPKDIR